MPNCTMPMTALIAPAVMMMSTTVSARRPAASRYAIGTIEEEQQLLAVDEADARIDREERRRPASRRRRPRAARTSAAPRTPLAAADDDASHRTPVIVSSSLGRDRSKTAGRREREQRVVRRALEPARSSDARDQRHHARAFIARSAAERTSSGLNVVRHRKSPGSQTR